MVNFKRIRQESEAEARDYESLKTGTREVKINDIYEIISKKTFNIYNVIC